MQEAEGLKPSVSLLEERWRIFKRNRLAYASYLCLLLLLIVAVVGKVLTRW
ncbi:MAG: ABC transporter permease, partial [Nitrospinaceae bacterium]|nr:ABC transporter permease [Nitrospinaceae bacterium]